MNRQVNSCAHPVPDDLEAFLDKHRQKLLQYLDGDLPAASDDPGPLDFIEQVLDEWHDRFLPHPLAEPAAEERTFWYTLYQLETVAGFSPGAKRHPYESILIDDLAKVRELLRQREPLPAHYFATRPGEW